MKKSKKLLISIIFLTVLFGSSFGVTLAWFSRTLNQDSNSFNPGKMTINIGADFNGNTSSDTSSSNSNSSNDVDSYVTNGVAILSANDKIYDPSSTAELVANRYKDNDNKNFIENFEVNIKASTSISSVLRVKVRFNTVLEKRSFPHSDSSSSSDSTTSNDSSTSNLISSSSIFESSFENRFEFATSNWTYDKVNNIFFYNDVIKKDDVIDTKFITKGKSISVNTKLNLYYQNYICNFYISVEMVQVNRYLAIWGEGDYDYPSSWPKANSSDSTSSNS